MSTELTENYVVGYIAINLARMFVVCCKFGMDISILCVRHMSKEKRIFISFLLEPTTRGLGRKHIVAEEHHAAIRGFKFGKIDNSRCTRTVSKTYSADVDVGINKILKRKILESVYNCLSAYMIAEPTLAGGIRQIHQQLGRRKT